MKLRLSVRAQRELDQQVDWLALRSPQAARDALAAVLHVFDLLEQHPELGMETDKGWREKGVDFGRDGYVICYVIRRDGIFVLRFKHGRQDRSR